MYAVTSIVLVSRTRATLRRAEFGFFGVTVYTRVHTPRRCGAAMRFLRPWPDFRPGVETFFLGFVRPFRTSWLMLGMRRVMVAAAPYPDGGRSPNGFAGTSRVWIALKGHDVACFTRARSSAPSSPRRAIVKRPRRLAR